MVNSTRAGVCKRIDKLRKTEVEKEEERVV
jgi:hypothetical protein